MRALVLPVLTAVEPDVPLRQAASLAGFLCFGLMALTLIWGILTTSGLAKRIVRRRPLYMTHLCLAIATLSFGTMHAMTYPLLTQERFTWINALVPFADDGNLKVAIGIVGLELMAALMATVIIRPRIGYRTWHTLHYGLYGAFTLALVHTVVISAATRRLGLLFIIVGALTLACAAMTVLRLLPVLRSD